MQKARTTEAAGDYSGAARDLEGALDGAARSELDEQVRDAISVASLAFHGLPLTAADALDEQRRLPSPALAGLP